MSLACQGTRRPGAALGANYQRRFPAGAPHAVALRVGAESAQQYSASIAIAKNQSARILAKHRYLEETTAAFGSFEPLQSVERGLAAARPRRARGAGLLRPQGPSGGSRAPGGRPAASGIQARASGPRTKAKMPTPTSRSAPAARCCRRRQSWCSPAGTCCS